MQFGLGWGWIRVGSGWNLYVIHCAIDQVFFGISHIILWICAWHNAQRGLKVGVWQKPIYTKTTCWINLRFVLKANQPLAYSMTGWH